MSEENILTIKVYKEYAHKYIMNSQKKEQEDITLANEKKRKLIKFFSNYFSKLPPDARIMEIGSGGGENAALLIQSGYNIIASDASDSFVLEMLKNDINAITFNVLEDDFINDIGGILCWRVFVHFTLEDAQEVLRKSYEALNDGGIMIFNAMNREYFKLDSEWKDMAGIYHMGVDRFYQYYNKSELDKIIVESGFHIIQFFTEGGIEKNKWLVYVVEK